MDNTENSQKQPILTGTFRKDLNIFSGNSDHSGNNTWVIFDPVADMYFRIPKKEYNVITFLDKNSNLDVLFEKTKVIDPDITKEYIIKTLSFLNNSGLMESNYKVTEHRLNQQRQLKLKTLPTRLMSSYLFFRIPLWNPDPFLNKTSDIMRVILNKWLVITLCIISIIGYISVVINWSKFTAAIIGSLSYSGLIRYGITIIILKIFHEFAHAYSAKFAGVRVRKFGIGFIIFFPRFFTDITDSWRIKSRNHRMFIDSAGILVELLIGGIAALVWLNSGPGSINTISYFVFAVSIINTILVNGNPFIRYDGYYLLMDFINIDNLQQQGSTEIKILSRKYFFGIKEGLSSSLKGWKKYFVVIYGISSFIYRIFLYTGIILIIYFKFTKAIGNFSCCS